MIYKNIKWHVKLISAYVRWVSNQVTMFSNSLMIQPDPAPVLTDSFWQKTI